jgi:hypothetical protein
MITSENIKRIALNWIYLWNEESLENYMEQYSEDIELVSNIAMRLFPDSNGRIKDKTVLQNYWSIERIKYPNFIFNMLDINIYDNKAIVYYEAKDKSMKAIAILTVNEQEKINRVEVSYM